MAPFAFSLLGYCFNPNPESSSAGTWTLNVLWKMCGIDVHMDPNIGKRLNALGNTLTSLTGEEDIDDIADLNSVNMADLSDEDEPDTMSPTVHMVSHLQLFLSKLTTPLNIYQQELFTRFHRSHSRVSVSGKNLPCWKLSEMQGAAKVSIYSMSLLWSRGAP